MLEIDIPAVLATAAVMFGIGAAWNGNFGSIMLEARGGEGAPVSAAMPVGRMLADAIRVLVIAPVAAIVLRLVDVADVWAAFQLAFLIWLGFQAGNAVRHGDLGRHVPPPVYSVTIRDHRLIGSTAGRSGSCARKR